MKAICAFSVFLVTLANASHCTTPCGPRGINFCGTDGQCHKYSCLNYYDYGPSQFTGHDGTGPPLSCQDGAGPILADDTTCQWEGGISALSFGCVGIYCAECDNDKSVNGMGFTRFCSVQPTLDTTFICYEMASDTNYVDFLNEVNMANLISCSDPDLPPAFIYLVRYMEFIPDEDGFLKSNAVVNGPNSTVEFDMELAQGAMHSELRVSLRPSASPTLEATSEPTSVEPSTSAGLATIRFAIVGVGIIWALLVGVTLF